MRILVVTSYFPPEPGACATRISELAAAWARHGHEVHVLTGMPCYPDGVVPPAWRGRAYLREELGGVTVHRGWVYPAANRGRLRRAAWYLSQAATMVAADVLAVPDVDVVVATSPHMLAAAAGALVARRRARPLVVEVRDLWPRSIWELGALPREGLAIRALERLERALYDRAAVIAVVSDAFREHVLAMQPGRTAGEVPTVTNGVDLSRFDPTLDRQAARRELGLDPSAPVALYAGTHGVAHGLEQVIEAARRAPEVQWLLVGAGARREHLLRRGAGVPNLHFRPVRPAADMASVYACADVGLVPLRALPVFETVVPSKLFEFWAMGRPVVLAARGEAERLVRRSGAGVAVAPEEPDALAAAVRTLMGDPALRARMGRAGRGLVEAEFDRTRIAEQYAAILERVRQAHPRRVLGRLRAALAR